MYHIYVYHLMSTPFQNVFLNCISFVSCDLLLFVLFAFNVV